MVVTFYKDFMEVGKEELTSIDCILYRSLQAIVQGIIIGLHLIDKEVEAQRLNDGPKQRIC